jgi:hypothetical protein
MKSYIKNMFTQEHENKWLQNWNNPKIDRNINEMLILLI